MGDHLGELETLILFTLLRLGDGAYGAVIRRELRIQADRDVSLGALYTALERLRRKELVSSWIGAPTAVRGGRRKKHYRLEPAGMAAIRLAFHQFSRLTDGLEPQLERLSDG